MSDAPIRKQETTCFDGVGVTPHAPSISATVRNGVSVDYILDVQKQWYVLRISYGRYTPAQELIHTHGLDFFHPFYHTRQRVNGKMKKVTKPLLWNLIFVYARPEQIQALMGDPHNNLLTFYYDHFTTNTYGKNPPLTVRESEMRNFIRLTSINNEHIRLVHPDQCRFRSGDQVRITQGDFAGITGRVAKAVGEQRVIVELSHLCLIATAYIPTAFLESIDSNTASETMPMREET